MEFLAYSPINIPDEFWGWLLGISAIILTIVGILVILYLVLLAYTVVMCLKSYPTGAVGKVIWLCVILFFPPFGSALYLLAYFLRDRNDQGSLDYDIEPTEKPDDESENYHEDSWGSGKVWGEKSRS